MYIIFSIVGAIILTVIITIINANIKRSSIAELQFIIEDLLAQKNSLNTELYEIEEEVKERTNEKDALNTTLIHLTDKRQELSKSIEEMSKMAKESGESIYKTNYELANTHFEQAAEKMCEEYRELREQLQQEYLETMRSNAEELQSSIVKFKIEKNNLQNEISNLRSVVDAAVQASRRKLEEEEKENFYRLILSENDINEIKRLREVLPFIKNAEALNKVIWTIYYQKPYTDLIARVFGDKKPCGIYKITNLQNQMVYVGQSVNVPERWRQHIKRGIGAEAPTRNKLYPAMLATGVENFSFEFVEECDKSQLDKKEQYWQEFFHAKDFGYSIK